MTRPLQKNLERFFAEQATKRLGADWQFGLDRENPDFVVQENSHRFGLEVCQIFSGQQAAKGSILKETESRKQREIDTLRRQYEATTNISLIVKFVGDSSSENLATVVESLIGLELATKPAFFHTVIDERHGLRVHVTKSTRSDWYDIGNRVGWVDQNPRPLIERAIEKKSEKLPLYKSNVGPDVRLLVVADRIHNSGKLSLTTQLDLNPRGFSTVYFFPFPEAAHVVASRG